MSYRYRNQKSTDHCSHHHPGKMPKRKIIIDCDAGSDDAFALMVALNQPDVKILAITCSGGNVALEHVGVNVMKVLELFNRTDIPLYKGASTPLMGQTVEDASYFFGEDGFSDVPDIPDPDMDRVKHKHAVNAIIKLAKKHPNEITLVALAPLSNIGLACRMFPELSKHLKNVVVMGGNDDGHGAEFNFKTDVQATSICLNEMTCPLTLVTFETCVRHAFTWEFYDQLISQGTAKSEFFRKIDSKPVKYYKTVMKKKSYTACDMFAMVLAVRPELIKEDVKVHASVKPFGDGKVIYSCEQPNVIVVKHVDGEKYKAVAFNALK